MAGLNILFVSQRNPFGLKPHGGAESSMRLLAEQLASRRNRVVYCTLDLTPESIALARKNGVELLSFRSFIPPGSRYSFVRKIAHEAIPAIYARREQFSSIDIIYTFYEEISLQFSFGLRRHIENSRLVLRMAGLYWYEKAKSFSDSKDFFAHVFREIDGINYIHPGLKSLVGNCVTLLKMDMPSCPELIQDIGSSAPLRTRKPRQRSRDTFSAAMVARFSDYQKRQDILIEAMQKLQERARINLFLVGEGSEKSRLMGMVHEFGLESRVIFMNFMPRDEVWEFIESMDLIVHAADYEGLGKIIIESMALGVPVLASDVTPMNDYITDGVDGFLVPNDPVSWAERLVDISRMPAQKLDDIGIQAAAQMMQEQDPARNVLAYERFFSELCEK